MTESEALEIIRAAAEHLPGCKQRMREALETAERVLARMTEAQGDSLDLIKKALLICGDGDKPCEETECPYRGDENCQRNIARDALACILRLEEDRK